MKKIFIKLIIFFLTLTYISSDIGQLQIKNFAENKFNEAVSSTIGHPFYGVDQYLNDIIRQIQMPL